MAEEEKMNRIILIGNGFDLAHGLKTRYKDFIMDFWKNEIKKSYKMESLKSNVTTDGKAYYIYEDDFVVVELKDFIDAEDEKNIDVFKKNIKQYKNKFLRVIELELYEKKWCDIETLYYKELIRCLNLKKNENDDYSIKQLNDDFEKIRKELENYLTEIMKNKPKPITDIINHLKDLKPVDTTFDKYTKTLFLNFNYTNTEDLYIEKKTDGTINNEKNIVIHIHGELNEKKNQMIFGYGDELDDGYKEIEKQENKEFQENLKFISYLKTKNYEELLNFMNEDDYEIYIFGHSCGNSDRTLLNFLFEEGCLKQCKKIRVFYKEDGDGTTNYNDIIKDISKQFNKKSKLRELVVKEKPLKTPETKPKKEPWEELEDYMVEVQVDKKLTDLQANFKISKFLVTQDLWKSIMGKKDTNFYFVADKNPAENVSWDEITGENGFLEKLNKKTGRKYRLPTDAEWEYAARGGVKSKNCEYAGCNTENELKYYAWYNVNSENTTHPVGQLKPNELGLYDMSGNVWEWCEDKCDWDDKKREVVLNDKGRYRVLRGGSWNIFAEYCRVSYRYYDEPGGRGSFIGFRLARSL